MIGPRHFLLGGIAAVAMGGAAFAADVPMRGPIYSKAPPPAWSWEGQYIGVHGGYASGTNDVVLGIPLGEFSPDGAFGGFQIGYNGHIARNWILGYEIDVSFGNLNSAPLGAAPWTLDFNTFGTARTRLGYVQGPWMLYATGGLAWATTTIRGPATLDRPHVGYAVGAGVEYAFAPHWSVKLEYLYADLGETNTFLGGATFNTDLTLSTVRLGLNYRFANWQAPQAAAFPVKAPVRVSGWTGAYFGLHAGYGWGNFDTTVAAAVASFEPTGGFGGFQAGYNWQLSPNWVIGLESDSSWGSINQTIGATNVDIDAMGTVRVRLGYAMNNLLIYGTGGLAFAHADSLAFVTDARDQFYLGYAAGFGLEYAFAPRWSAKLEYIYADYGTINDFVAVTRTVNLETQTIKVGINYRASILELIGWR